MKPKIKTRITNLIAKLADSPDYVSGIKLKEPIEFYLSDAVDRILSGDIGVTPASIVNASETMTENQARSLIGNINKAVTVMIGGSTPTIKPVSNAKYQCGALNSLTVDSAIDTGDYSIVFTSLSPATVTEWGDNIRWPDGISPTLNVNTTYEVNVSDGRAIIVGWPLNVGD